MKFYLPFLLLFWIHFINSANATLRPKATTRLLGTAGAGVGSIMAPESVVFNPASAEFFDKSHLYYNRNEFSFDENKQNFDRDDTLSQDFIITDASSAKGGVGIIHQREKDIRRKSYNFALATSAGKSTSIGFLFSRNEQSSLEGNDVFNQLSLGFSKVFSEILTGGLLIKDISEGSPSETTATLGLQYNISQNFSVLFDWGGYYLTDFFKNTFYNAALQISLGERVILRTGIFENNVLNIKGNGWGASWIGPKISFEFGIRHTEATDDGYFLKDEKSKEISAAIDIRF